MNKYVIEFSDPAGHLIDLTMTIASPQTKQTVSMPAWIPGSYMIREFAKNIVSLSAEQGGRAVLATKLDKATWSIDSNSGAPLTIRYRVYAWDRSVRTNYFDQSRGFVNPASLCFRNDAAANAQCEVIVIAPTFAEGSDWKCATSMTPKATDARGFGTYQSSDFDELIDHPFECAAFDEFTFEAGGVPHRFVISGKHRGDLERLKVDTQKICQAHVDLFSDNNAGGVTKAAPFDHYVFQLHVVDEGYGGLEHRASTALIAPRNNLPIKGDATISEGYLELLGLISHEYFHAWNVKRIKPAAFTPYDVTQENYTRLLWLFEGFTSYYDELMLVRAGLITENDYLKMIARHLTQLMRTPARAIQSIADSSFDAWIKYYRQDENAPNAIVSYYLKGGLIALLLDLKLRSESKGTLDDLMRFLWREFGTKNIGVPEDAFAVFEQYTGISLREFEAKYVTGTDEPDWASAFASAGINFETRVSLNAADRGGPAIGTTPEMHLRRFGIVLNDAGEVKLKYVMSDSAAHAAGLCAGDTLVAIDGLKATRNTLMKHVLRFVSGNRVAIHFFRQDVLRETTIVVPEAQHDTVILSLRADARADRLPTRLVDVAQASKQS
jgi:predicted metalloprotease with PDZ domain